MKSNLRVSIKNLTQHHSLYEVYSPPVMPPLRDGCKEGVLHLSLLGQHCLADTERIVAVDSKDSSVDRTVDMDKTGCCLPQLLPMVVFLLLKLFRSTFFDVDKSRQQA